MKRLIFILLSANTLLFPIRGSVSIIISKAEELMREEPGISLSLLESISPSMLRNDKQYAQYALLKSQALDKNYIDIDSDSLIKKAVVFYENTNDHRHKMLAYYYEGIVLVNGCNYTKSAIYFEKAIQEATLLSDYLFLGLSYRALANIMNATKNLTQAIEYDEKAIESFQKGEETLYEQYGWLTLAIDCSNDKQFSRAISIADSLYTIINSDILKDGFEQVKAEALIESGNCDFHIPVDIYKRANKYYFTPTDYGYYAYALDRINLRDSADLYIQKALSTSYNHIDSAGVKVFQARIENNRAHYKNAYQLLSDAVDVQDSLTRELLRQSVSVAQKDYFNKEAQYQALRAKTAKLHVFIISLASILAFAIFLFCIILRQRKKDSLIKDQMAQLALEKGRTNKLYTEKAHILGSLFSERIGHLDRLAEEYISAETPEEKEIIFREYKHRCSSLFKDKHIYKILENDLNKHCDGLMEKLRTDFPTLKERQLNTFILFFTGLPTIVIQAITAKPSLKAVEMERYRCRKIIRESGANHAQTFLNMLDSRKRQPEE